MSQVSRDLKSMARELEAAKGDNIKLLERLKYVQGYKTTGRTLSSIPSPLPGSFKICNLQMLRKQKSVQTCKSRMPDIIKKSTGERLMRVKKELRASRSSISIMWSILAVIYHKDWICYLGLIKGLTSPKQLVQGTEFFWACFSASFSSIWLAQPVSFISAGCSRCHMTWHYVIARPRFLFRYGSRGGGAQIQGRIWGKYESLQWLETKGEGFPKKAAGLTWTSSVWSGPSYLF